MAVTWIVNQERNEIVFLVSRGSSGTDRIVYVPGKPVSEMSESEIRRIAGKLEEDHGNPNGG